MWFQEKGINRCGCGVIAAYDFLLYVTQKNELQDPVFLSRDMYIAELRSIQKKYFPLLYPFGLTGVQLAIGMNRLFRDRALPYRAVWSVSERKLLFLMHEMLLNDIPVILAIGPNFPFFWEKHKLSLYSKDSNGSYRKASDVKAHYITVVGIDDIWMKISSWGKEFYIRIDEYQRYIKNHSSFITSNLLLIKKQ